MNKTKLFIVILLISLLGFSIISCVKEDDYNTDSSFNLEFSTNELLFDTVFTSLGSTTKQLMVYNKGDKPIKISRARISGGAASPFRINIDGNSSAVVQDIEIAAKDSMYIFANVTINPNSSTTPFLVKDSIEFLINNKYQYFPLTAFGQNAIYHYPNKERTLPDGKTVINYSYANCGQPWNNTLPHVIYGYCLVDKDSTLVIEAGTQVYFYNKSSLLIYEGGTLKVNENGSFGNPVVFQSMRKDEQYKDLAGQWNSIRFMQGSQNNIINWAIIRNGTIGLEMDSCNENSNISISNTIIENMSHAGIYAKTAKIQAYNLLVANCQNYLLALTLGGNYSFTQCTFANYWRETSRKTPSILLTNKLNLELFPLTGAYFQNCIVYGSQNEELEIDLDNSTSSNYQFNYCLLKTQSQEPTHFIQCSVNNDPKFVNTEDNDYHLGSASAAIGRGNPSYSSQYPFDLDNVERKTPPAIGAYEYTGSSKRQKR